MSKSVSVVLALLGICCGVSGQLQCYSGTGDSRSVTTCMSTQTLCKSWTANGLPPTFSCSPADSGTPLGCSQQTISGSQGTQCYCNSNLCNAATLTCYAGVGKAKTATLCDFADKSCRKEVIKGSSPVYNCSSMAMTSNTETVYYCNTSLCNGGNRNTALSFVTLVVVLIISTVKMQQRS